MRRNALIGWTERYDSFTALIAATVRAALTRGATRVDIAYTEANSGPYADVRVTDDGPCPTRHELTVILAPAQRDDKDAPRNVPHPLFGFVRHALAVHVECADAATTIRREHLLTDEGTAETVRWEPLGTGSRPFVLTFLSVGHVTAKEAEDRTSHRLRQELARALRPEEFSRVTVTSDCVRPRIEAAA